MSVPSAAHVALSAVEEGEGNDDDWTSKSNASPSLQLEEAAFRSKLKREATISLIASLHSLKPVPVADTRLVDMAIMNEVCILFPETITF